VSDRFDRARRILTRDGDWWVSLSRSVQARAGAADRGMRRHVAGEFRADGPWLLRLSLLGEFVRVPETLVHKVWLKSGLSLGWRHSPWQRLGVMLSCMGVVRRAGFTWSEELRLYRTVLLAPLKRRWWTVRGRWSTPS
jgi:hypothetical protein